MQKKNVPQASGNGPEPEQLHKPPSMLWFVIPLGLLLLYAALTR